MLYDSPQDIKLILPRAADYRRLQTGHEARETTGRYFPYSERHLHVLWFDEAYDEFKYRFQSSIKTAQMTDFLITVGTSAATNLPNQVVNIVYQNQKPILDINIEFNPFAQMAQKTRTGFFVQETSSRALPLITKLLIAMDGN